jgi:hypothetical protein
MTNEEKKATEAASERGSAALNDGLGAVLDYVVNALDYTRATISPGNRASQKGEWVEIHRGRADSSYRLLSKALEKIAKIRV